MPTTYASEPCRVFTVTVEQNHGKVIGHARLYEMPVWKNGAPKGYCIGNIQDVWVHPEHRSQGIARRLMEDAHKIARLHGMQHITLTSNPSRTHARALYRSLGYEITSEGFKLKLE